MARVLVGMSGGVDSSVAVRVLQEQGHDCEGVTMALHAAATSRDVDDAREVARLLGVAHRTVDFSAAFEESVERYFVSEYESGRTPNPCAVCNREIKFGLLLDYALEQGFDYLATGHYARVEHAADGCGLYRGEDRAKDQSYFLALVGNASLAHALLPLGGMAKPEVRQKAGELGLPNAQKSESQDVCFIPGDDYRAFLEERRDGAYPPGDILDERGAVVGRHRGLPFYTVGQRKGLGVAMGQPVFVFRKDPENNTVSVGAEARLMASGLVADGWNWSSPGFELPLRVQVKTHYRAGAQPATLHADACGGMRVAFDEPQRAVACGQVAVAYRDDLLVGGGVIDRVL